MIAAVARVAVLAAAVLLPAVPLAAADAPPVGDPYPFTTDAATGEPLGEKTVKLVHEGRELRFATQANADAFKDEPKRYLARLDERIVQDQLPHYPLATCPVSGEALDSMGEPDNFVFRNRLVRLCCPGCRDSVEQDAAGVFAKLDAAVIEKQKAAYPLKECPISGEDLGTMGEPTDLVVAHRLVRLCCEGCIGDVRANTGKVIAQVDAARQGDGGAETTAGGHRHGHDHGHGHHHHEGHGH